MRTLFAIAMMLAAGLAASAPATALDRDYGTASAGHLVRRGDASTSDAECERRAQFADPTGKYAGYPCWARYAFGQH